jgi:hypothetical protein
MCAVKTSLTDIDTETLKRIMGEIRKAIPVGFNKHKEPQDSYDLKISPQPFNPNLHTEFKIDGLAENSEIKIMTLSGEVVKTLFSNSKTIIWDGRDEGRRRVSSGVYLISTSSGNSEKSGVIKFAVIW